MKGSKKAHHFRQQFLAAKAQAYSSQRMTSFGNAYLV
jgi:hypothetical protein